MVKVDRDLSADALVKYTHLPHEVLSDPPAAYTPSSEMYSVGIMMWEMWTQKHAYEDEIEDEDDPLDSIDKFVAYIETNRPSVELFQEADDKPISAYAETWIGQMQQCWAESERLTAKALLQLMDDVKASDALPMKEHHFGKD